MNLRTLGCMVGVVAMMMFPTSATLAKQWPTKPVHIIVGWSAGGATDVIARYIAQKLSERLGQQFIVETKPGAGGNIGAEYVARAPADGHTLIFLTSAHAINATLYRNLPFDPMISFTPLAMVGNMTQLLVVNPRLPYQSVQELIADAKQNPGKLKFASAGSGSSSHLAVEQLSAKAGIEVLHVPYKGTSQYISDLVSGRVDFAIDSATALLPLTRSKELRALAVSSYERSSTLPEIPTIAESGVPGYGVNLWFGYLGPAGMAPSLVDTINREIRDTVSEQSVVDKLKGFGLTVSADFSPSQFRELLSDDIGKYAAIIQASGAGVE
ncbi:MAG TPA: tripartite tricarboxylate transporter substrate binding protein [Burkholderiaceae bacterium]|nr:tripartite tricarboxylate transporter substrate binding protein [Burkholderiaceae bacterium]